MSVAGRPVRVFLGDASVVDPLVHVVVEETVSGGSTSLDFETVRFGERPLAEVGSALRQVGMFSTSRCIWLRGFAEAKRRGAGAHEQEEDGDANDDGADDGDGDSAGELLALLESGIPEGSVLIVSAASLDARGRLFKWITKNAEVVDRRVQVERTGRLGEQGLREAVEERLRELGVQRVDPSALAEVMRRSGNALGETLQEVDRLVLALPDPTVLRLDDVRASMRDLALGWVFDLTKAIDARELGTAEALIERLLAQGEAPIRLAALLASHVGNLVAARPWVDRLPRGALNQRGTDFLKNPGIPLPDFLRGWPGWFRLKAAAAFRADELARFHRSVLELDLALKSSPVDPLLLFSRMLQGACLAGARR